MADIYLFLESVAEMRRIATLQVVEYSPTEFSHEFPEGNPSREEVMSKRNISSTQIATQVAIPALVMFLVVNAARAQNISADYTFLVASGFLCDSATCPAAVRSANDDSYEMSGAGTFNKIGRAHV